MSRAWRGTNRRQNETQREKRKNGTFLGRKMGEKWPRAFEKLTILIYQPIEQPGPERKSEGTRKNAESNTRIQNSHGFVFPTASTTLKGRREV